MVKNGRGFQELASNRANEVILQWLSLIHIIVKVQTANNLGSVITPLKHITRIYSIKSHYEDITH